MFPECHHTARSAMEVERRGHMVSKESTESSRRWHLPGAQPPQGQRPLTSLHLTPRERARKQPQVRQATDAKNPKAQAIKLMHLTEEGQRDLAGNLHPQRVRHVFIT